MLQQILKDMYIDPELLAELPEDQKQYLFDKMREEQVRRWYVREKELEKEDKEKEKKPKKPRKPGKKVDFMSGSDGNEWVWVMGEHANDKSIAQILEEEAEQKAIEQAEREIRKEMEEARKEKARAAEIAGDAEDSKVKLDAEEKKIEDNLGRGEDKEKEENDAEEKKEEKAEVEEIVERQKEEEKKEEEEKKKEEKAEMEKIAERQKEEEKKEEEKKKKEKAEMEKIAERQREEEKKEEEKKKEEKAEIEKIVERQKEEEKKAEEKTVEKAKAEEELKTDNQKKEEEKVIVEEKKAEKIEEVKTKDEQKKEEKKQERKENKKETNEVKKDEPKKPAENGQVASPAIKGRKPSIEGVQLRQKAPVSEEEQLRKLIMRRSREILFDFKNIRARFEQMAKSDSKERKRHWRKQEEKARAVEAEIRQARIRVREEQSRKPEPEALFNLQLLQAEPASGPAEEMPSNLASPPPIPAKPARGQPVKPQEKPPTAARGPGNVGPLSPPPPPPRPRVTRRPASRQAAAAWFLRHQKPRGAGIDPETRSVATWFHGLISRTEAEIVLEEVPPGAFVVRISERLFGYAVSVRDQFRCKHFLVEALTEGGYRLFGVGEHRVHATLSDFVDYHGRHPLTAIGQEKLLTPVAMSFDSKKEQEDFYVEFFPERPCQDIASSL